MSPTPTPTGPTVEQLNEILARTEVEPTLAAVITFVTGMCDCAAREATGFHTASTINTARDYHTARFIWDMENATVPEEQGS